MLKIKFDNNEYNAPEGSTILDAAAAAGFYIPAMCHKNGIPHYSSCMVCIVKDKLTGNFVPACSALVQDGMELDISGEEVIALRKKAVEMLLSEHRAECEAPCRVVCPAGYNIPLMNRLLSEKDYKGVVELVESEIQKGELKCIDCPAYCENACRRKKIDTPVSIRNIKLLILKQVKTDDLTFENFISESTLKPLKRFTSRIGKVEPSELEEWLKECVTEIKRFKEIPDFTAASSESESCMHCDCRALNDCRLRDIAEALSVKDPRGKIVNSPIVKKINLNTGLVFENAKCIKCGLCVRICEDTKDEPALCFIHRGFVSIISEPLTVDFDGILQTQTDKVVEICPTGALSKYK